MKTFILISLCLLGATIISCSGIDYWKAIKSDPQNWVDRELSREIVSGEKYDPLPRFNKEDPHFRTYNDEWKRRKFNINNKKTSDLKSLIFTAWKQQDAPEQFFRGKSYISDLSKLPLSGKSSQEPWSSTYWPIQYGILSIRYDNNPKNTISDEEGNRLTWKQSVQKYSQPQEFEQLSGENLTSYIDKYFSAAEKYDLLVGDTKAFTLTNNNKQQGSQYEDSNGDVESWMGICHGWAPAAFSVPRPQNDVVVTAADGKTKIRFYADDIRGLASMRFASTNEDTVFAGGRCNIDGRKVAKDPATGLATDYTCFDINPGSWVIILANQLGINKKSFVIDATWDLQVWNQPMYSYSMSFFNILNDQEGDLEASKVAPSEIAKRNEPILKFLSKRTSKQATSVVGVNMEIVYIAETSPSHNPPGPDKQVKVTYTFTLELDNSNSILGGEWLHNQHPDFIWAPADGARPVNEEDSQIASGIRGDISSPEVLQQLTPFAQSASSRGEVLGIVVDYLVAKSSGTHAETE